MKKSDKLEIKKIEEDPRGYVYSLDFNGKKFLIFSFRKDALRGGHYHNLDTLHFIIYGSLEMRTKFIDGNKDKVKIVKGGDIIPIESRKIHLFKAKEDSLMLEQVEKNLKTTEYKPYRKAVNEFIEKSK